MSWHRLHHSFPTCIAFPNTTEKVTFECRMRNTNWHYRYFLNLNNIILFISSNNIDTVILICHHHCHCASLCEGSSIPLHGVVNRFGNLPADSSLLNVVTFWVEVNRYLALIISSCNFIPFPVTLFTWRWLWGFFPTVWLLSVFRIVLYLMRFT